MEKEYSSRYGYYGAHPRFKGFGLCREMLKGAVSQDQRVSVYTGLRGIVCWSFMDNKKVINIGAAELIILSLSFIVFFILVKSFAHRQFSSM